MRTRLDMVGIFVRDIGVMAAFYRDVLGFQTQWNGEGPYAEFQNDGVRVSMYVRLELPGLLGCEPSYPQGINGTFELAIDLPDTQDVDREYGRIVNGGAAPVYPPREEPWGMYSSMVADPEGNLIEIGSWKKGTPPTFDMGFVTVSVSSLETARAFYEGVLGLKADIWYEPTKWLSFTCGGRTMFAIQEAPGMLRQAPGDMVDFYTEDIDVLWERVKDRVDAVHGPQQTPWGSYKFIIRDPDGYLVAVTRK